MEGTFQRVGKNDHVFASSSTARRSFLLRLIALSPLEYAKREGASEAQGRDIRAVHLLLHQLSLPSSIISEKRNYNIGQEGTTTKSSCHRRGRAYPLDMIAASSSEVRLDGRGLEGTRQERPDGRTCSSKRVAPSSRLGHSFPISTKAKGKNGPSQRGKNYR